MYPMDFPVERSTNLYVKYADGYCRALKGHVEKNRRRVFVGGKYYGTERKLGIKGGRYRTLAEAENNRVVA